MSGKSLPKTKENFTEKVEKKKSDKLRWESGSRVKVKLRTRVRKGRKKVE